MVRSMTGYAAREAEIEGIRLAVQLRTVNHRFLDLRLTLPKRLQAEAASYEALLRTELQRGHADLSIHIHRPEAQGSALAAELLSSASWMKQQLSAVTRLREALGAEAALLEDKLPLSWLLEHAPPAVEVEAVMPEPDPEWLKDALETLVKEALTDLVEMRAREGSALKLCLKEGLDRIKTHAKRLRDDAKASVKEAEIRLKTRLEALLQDTELDPARFQTEVAILADKSDVTEELDRLDIHVLEFRRILGDTGPIGRRLDFLLQELNREANTVGSKCQNPKMAHTVVDLKAEMERLREQVQNIE